MHWIIDSLLPGIAVFSLWMALIWVGCTVVTVCGFTLVGGALEILRNFTSHLRRWTAEEDPQSHLATVPPDEVTTTVSETVSSPRSAARDHTHAAGNRDEISTTTP